MVRQSRSSSSMSGSRLELAPDVDGFTLVGLFRANPATARTPIVVLSGNDDGPTRARASEAGATDFLVKVPAKGDLVACIRKHAASVEAPASAGDAKVIEDLS